MQTFLAPHPVLSGRRQAKGLPAAGALVASLLASAGVISPAHAADAATAKQAPLLVGLRSHAVTAAVIPAPALPAPRPQAEAPARKAAAISAEAPAPIPAPNAPIPPVRPAEYCVQQAAALEAPEFVASADGVPLPPERPAELSAPQQTAQVTPQVAPQVFVDAPLPPARPEGLGVNGRVAARAPEAPAPRMATRETTVVPGTAAPQEPSFFDRLFGRAETPQPEQQYSRRQGRRALAYAAQEPATGSSFFGGASSVLQNASPNISEDRYTAVYDISAQTVFLPDGTRLEAHSGLRESRDDPRSVHLRMRGSTPPNVYELTPREQLFHGVQALRLNPVAGHTYGRNGLLAHTYMLGPNGDSNGCVSFRDYHAFLRAYQNGQIRRLAVVAHR